jgi:hypothetical protein
MSTAVVSMGGNGDKPGILSLDGARNFVNAVGWKFIGLCLFLLFIGIIMIVFVCNKAVTSSNSNLQTVFITLGVVIILMSILIFFVGIGMVSSAKNLSNPKPTVVDIGSASMPGSPSTLLGASPSSQVGVDSTFYSQKGSSYNVNQTIPQTGQQISMNQGPSSGTESGDEASAGGGRTMFYPYMFGGGNNLPQQQQRTGGGGLVNRPIYPGTQFYNGRPWPVRVGTFDNRRRS